MYIQCMKWVPAVIWPEILFGRVEIWIHWPKRHVGGPKHYE